MKSRTETKMKGRLSFMTSLTRQFIEENESGAVRIVERSARCYMDEWKEWFEYYLV